MNDNAGANTYKLVQDFLERETVVQLYNPPYSPDLSPCDLTETTPSPYVDISLKELLAVQLFRAYMMCPKTLLICNKSQEFKTRNCVYHMTSRVWE